MAEDTQVKAADVVDNPLAAAFPGKTVELRNGSKVMVHKWTAREIVHEVPALFGRIALRLGEAFGDDTSIEGKEAKVSQIIGSMASEAAELLAFTTKRPVGELLDLDADEFLMLVRLMLEVNNRFFGEMANLYQLAKRDLPGT